MSDHLAVVAAADQAHAEAEDTLDGLIDWWGQAKTEYASGGKADEVAALTHILTVSSPTNYAALLATAIARLTDKENDDDRHCWTDRER
jgi:hypothetical protein